MTPSTAFITYLEQVRRRVGEIWTAPAQNPAQLDRIPDFDALVAAARAIDRADPDKSAYIASTIVQVLLGRAASVDCANPPTTQPVFPADHRLHLDMGLEWYWFGIHLRVTNTADPSDTGRIAILYVIERWRSVGLTVQKLAGWEDTAAQIASVNGTVTIETKTEKSYHRRAPLVAWPAVGGSASFSAANEPLRFQCGPDSIEGSIDVLPLKLRMDDGQLRVDLKLNNPRMDPGDAFFLQGGPPAPAPGVTPPPTPGIYYSWPQLDASGTVRVAGKHYRVDEGSAWCDHQLMASSLTNLNNAARPLPFVDAPRPLNGWSWQYFNLKNRNRDALTFAAFQQGQLNKLPIVPYGFYLKFDSSKAKWKPSRLFGLMALEDFQCYSPFAGGGPPSRAGGEPPAPTVPIPTHWKYLLASLWPTPLLLVAKARKWDYDSTFNAASGELLSEMPSDLTQYALGVSSAVAEGFCESLGFEPVAQNRERALAYLASVTP